MPHDCAGMSDSDAPRSKKGLSQKNERTYHLIELCSGSRLILDDEQFSIFSEALSLYLTGKNVVSAGVRCREFGSETESWQVIYLSHLVRRCDYAQLAPDIEPVGRATVEKPSERPDDHYNGKFEVSGY